jgi:hypothetical protein
MWTRFMDMHSGGGLKESPYHYIHIEAPEKEARVVFYNRFGHNPERVTCTCCGQDYYIAEDETLEQQTAYDRNCRYDEESDLYVEERGRYGEYQTLDEYLARPDVLVIPAGDIKDEERVGEVPEQGYVWR